MNHHLARTVAALSGFFAVALGAFGAHALHYRLDALSTSSIWQTGVLYHLVHAVVLLVICGWDPFPRRAFWLMFGGIVVFSGSFYKLGGLGMLGGWLALALKGKTA
jgi:uncharacterized membrane protein YgdD (TMEM256/DUF423 family)